MVVADVVVGGAGPLSNRWKALHDGRIRKASFDQKKLATVESDFFPGMADDALRLGPVVCLSSELKNRIERSGSNCTVIKRLGC